MSTGRPSLVPPVPPAFAHRLLGRSLPGGWHVIELAQRGDFATGSNFSVGYVVEDAQGRRAFLKALNLTRALLQPDPTRALQVMTSAFNYERDLVNTCRDRRMRRVVLAVADGSVMVEQGNAASVVPYLIFELADGDVRAHINFAQALDLARIFRTLHHAAIGLLQLHRHDIAHQDVKPSNVMIFGGRTPDTSAPSPDFGAKLGDLGRASQLGITAAHDALDIAGDPTYAPPEQLYGATPTEWVYRRYGCDLYQLGGLAVYLLTNMNVTALWTDALPDQFRPGRWAGSYAQVLPMVRDAFDRMLTLLRQYTPTEYTDDVVSAVRQLCEPNPVLRGHPRARAVRYGNPMDVSRYVTLFDLLAARAGARARRGATATSAPTAP